ncbi:MAG TPA: YkgJ family cysteine cluster protein, partial [Myxococcota bacterium]|nr:YkgJ family cysteine cluster protein [Myxococcota bacterium]
MTTSDDAGAWSQRVGLLHAAVDELVAPLAARHGDRLACRRGCHGCCRDGLTVFEVEADRIRALHPDLLRDGAPAPAPGCAFLDADGACRVYDARPYVCRTQGLPLRWADGGAERRFGQIAPSGGDG